jgi:hypothetical protein
VGLNSTKKSLATNRHTSVDRQRTMQSIKEEPTSIDSTMWSNNWDQEDETSENESVSSSILSASVSETVRNVEKNIDMWKNELRQVSC